MSETRAVYKVERKDLNGVRNTTLLPYNQGFEQPTPEEIRSMIAFAGSVTDKDKITGSEFGNLVGVDPRTIRKWVAPIEAKNHTKIPYAAWRLLLIYCGLVEIASGDIYQEVAENN